MGSLKNSFVPQGLLRLISAEEQKLLEWLLQKPGLPEVETMVRQMENSIVHEIEVGRYLEFLVNAQCPALKTFERGIYVNAYASLDETHGIEAILYVNHFRVASLELSFSPVLPLRDLPRLDAWRYL